MRFHSLGGGAIGAKVQVTPMPRSAHPGPQGSQALTRNTSLGSFVLDLMSGGILGTALFPGSPSLNPSLSELVLMVANDIHTKGFSLFLNPHPSSSENPAPGHFPDFAL